MYTSIYVYKKTVNISQGHTLNLSYWSHTINGRLRALFPCFDHVMPFCSFTIFTECAITVLNFCYKYYCKYWYSQVTPKYSSIMAKSWPRGTHRLFEKWIVIDRYRSIHDLYIGYKWSRVGHLFGFRPVFSYFETGCKSWQS